MWKNVTLFFEENITLYEVTEIVQTVKMKSLYFLYWCLMLVFLLSVCYEWQCVLSQWGLCIVFGCTEPVLSHVLRVVLLGVSFAGDVNCLAQVTVGSEDCS